MRLECPHWEKNESPNINTLVADAYIGALINQGEETGDDPHLENF